MQVPTIPPPIITSTLPQEIAARAVPNVQAVTPLAQNAVDPTAKPQKFNDAGRDKQNPERDDEENRKEGEDKDGGNDHTLNIRI